MRNTNNKLYIMVGLSASGKSTLAEQMLLSDENRVRVSRDEYRYMWRNAGVVSDKIESVITQRVNQDIEYYLRNGFTVIYDATNLNKHYLDVLVADFSRYAEIEFIVLDVDVEECIRRDSLRERKVGEAVIRNQHEKFQTLMKTFDFSPVKKQKIKYRNQIKDAKKINAIVFDLDGTVADLGDRDPYGNGVLNDKVVEAVRDVINSFANSFPGYTVFAVSGREEKTRKDTEYWLNFHGVQFDKLFLRVNGDRRRDSAIKRQIYRDHILPNYNVHFVLDDRDQVVNMLRNDLGLTVFQVASGNF